MLGMRMESDLCAKKSDFFTWTFGFGSSFNAESGSKGG
jgi:hypothetical protein